MSTLSETHATFAKALDLPLDTPSEKIAEQFNTVVAKLDHEKVERAMKSTFDSKEFKDFIEAEIRELAKHTLDVKKRFETIRNDLDLFDGKKYKKKDGSDVETLKPGWEALYNTYLSLVKSSTDEARELKALCDEYVEMIVPMAKDKGSSLDDLIKYAEDYRDRTQVHGTKAQWYATEFEKLRLGVEAYPNKIDLAIGDAEAGLDEQIKVVKKKISDVELKIAEQNAFISRCELTEKAAGGAAIGSVILGNVFPVLAPLAGLVLLGSLLSIAGAEIAMAIKKAQLNTSLSELSSLKRDLFNLECKQKELAALKSKLQGSKGDIQFIAQKIGALANFWHAVFSDAELVLKKLKLAKTNASEFTVRQALGTRMAGDIYISMSDVLGLYAGQLNELNPEKK
ncbi:hypothetical protein SISNIDRAFT_450741 [Sistotremastrum niveocremeum HHB9708]|uniref:Uncharacterized protein n=2 Tax=Sistotremastraceae TaxID=3402574 RepID=A0A164YIS9_9AGAM|nr:hypothetical protein SISNIDRAFT_450741 [Sistotremastrum niveocremeum HHB9708]KZT43377.1 hypothetical protein SISSUDRAFT_1040387 [Sistotremastrum suecicum HHB10207 ss-3]